MVTPSAFRKLALSFAGAHEEPHFDRASFRVGKKIFATMTASGEEAMIRVKPAEAALALIEAQPHIFFSYGGFTLRNGALGVHLAKADTRMLTELLAESWKQVAPKPRAPKKSR